MDETEFLMPPRDAAKRLGVAPSTLRRLAPTYEAVHGLLPWEGESSGGSRLWPERAVERVAGARALVAAGRAKSLDSALRALAEGAQVPDGGLAPPVGDDAAALRFELEQLKAGLEQAVRQAVRDELSRYPAPELPEPRQGPFARIGGRLDALLRRLRG